MDSTAAKSGQLFIFNKQKTPLILFINSRGKRIFDTRQGPAVFTLFNTNASNVQLNASLAPLQEGVPGLALQSSPGTMRHEADEFTQTVERRSPDDHSLGPVLIVWIIFCTSHKVFSQEPSSYTGDILTIQSGGRSK